ncbi:MAG: NADH-quinone oxidoreductase subunit J [Cytophagaceae bacterium]|jgi:NADH-quinone oxidoreductase subunit J|nr:NADH-quinone oxidoreductase subunit J [Cytophagaceae bacterium]
MEQIIFIILSVLAVVGALAVIFSSNAVYSVLFLVLTFFAIAGHFILLNAQFLAIVNIIVYAGAIMVLFLFVIMLLNLNKDSEAPTPALARIAGAIAAGLLMVTIVGAFKGLSQGSDVALRGGEIGTVSRLGQVLFSDFLLPFEISSVLFLSAMIGAVMLGKKNLKDS